MRNLILEYSLLKTQEDARDAQLKAARDRLKDEIEGIEAQYPDLDNSVRKLRLQIQGEAAAMPNQVWETEHGTAEIQQRPSWDIKNPSFLRGWLDNHDKADLWEYKFAKSDINRICSGLSTANMPLPDGMERIEIPTLAISLLAGELVE